MSLIAVLVGVFFAPLPASVSYANGTPLPSCRVTDGSLTTQNGHYIQNQIRVEPIFAKRLYVDLRAGYDATYIGYRITNQSGSSLTDAWITLDDWGTSPAVSLSRMRDGEQRIGALANNATVTKYFLVKANSYSESNQSHTVKIFSGGFRATESLACTSTIQGVQRSISARANKVTAISSTTPTLGQNMTITVSGAPGKVGAGNGIDGTVMTLSPTNYSSWPTAALQLIGISALINTPAQSKSACAATNGGGIPGSGNDKTVTFSDRLVLRDFGKCVGNKSTYTITYTFKVIGAVSTNPTITPVSDISSGTQIKYTGGYPSETASVDFSDFSALGVPSSVSAARVAKDYVGASAVIDPNDPNRLRLTYEITASTTDLTSISVDEIQDNAPPGATLVSASATFTDVTRTASTNITPTVAGSISAPVLRFVGPFSVSSATSAVITYSISVPFADGTAMTYDNSAFGLFGSYTIGSNTNTVGGIQLGVTVTAGTVGTVSEQTTTAKLPQEISFSAPAALGEGSTLTLTGYSDSGLPLTYTVSGFSTCLVSQFNGVWTLTMVGSTCEVTASQAGDSAYAAAVPVTRTITSLPGQTISHSSLSLTDGVTSGSITVQSTSTLEVTIVNLTPDECTATKSSFDASTGVSTYTVTALTTGGTCILSASQAGDGSVGAAMDVDIVIGIGSGQRIVFGGLPSGDLQITSPPTTKSSVTQTTLTAESRVGATGSSTTKTMLPVILTSLTPSICRVVSEVNADGELVSPYNTSTGVTSTKISLVSAGDCVLRADQDGYTDDGTLSGYAAASPVTYTFTVLSSGTTVQSITLTTPASKTYGDAVFSISAVSKKTDNSNTGLLVTLEVSSGPCTVGSASLSSGITGAQISLQGGGSCVIRATQGGNGTYAAATPVTQTITVAAKPLTVTGLSIPSRKYDGTTSVTFSGTPTLSGVVPGDNASHVALSGTAAGTLSAPDVGNYSVTVTGLSLTGSKADASYSLTAPTVSSTITARLITLTPNNQTIQENAPAPGSCTVSVSGDGLASGDAVTAPSCTYGSYNGSGTGTHAITLASHGIEKAGSSVSGNYTVTLATGTLTVSAGEVLSITVTGGGALTDFTVVYGEGIPQDRLNDPRVIKSGNVEATGTFAHKFSGATLSSATNLPVGSHTVTVEFTATGSETASASPGTRVITVTARPVAYSFSSPTRVYDGTTTAELTGFSLTNTGVSASGVVAGDDVTLQAPSSGAFALASVGTHSLSWSSPTLAGAKAGNYDLQAHGAKTGTINPRPLSIRVGEHSRLVGESNPSFVITQASSGSGQGVVVGETLADAIGAGTSVTVVSYTTDSPGAYGLRPETPNSSSNYAITRQNGTLYVGQIQIAVQESNSVLTSRNVVCTCEGLKPNSQATLTIYSTPTQITTINVNGSGNCPSTTATIPNSVPDGNHTLELAGLLPTDTPGARTRAVTLDSTAIIVAPQQQNPGNGGGGGNSGGGGVTPSTITPSGPGNSGITPAPRPRPRVPATPTPLPPVVTPPTTVEAAPSAPQTPGPPRVPGLPGLRLVAPTTPQVPGQGPATSTTGPGGPANAGGFSATSTVDFGDDTGPAPLQNPGNGNSGAVATSTIGVRTVAEVAQEKLGGFAPGAGTILEILGARTAARFVVTEATLVDSFVLQRAIEESIPAQAANFFSIERVQPALAPLTPRSWSVEDRAGITQVFEASGLPAPRNLAELEVSPGSEWILLEARSATYAPGTEVYLTLTSEPIVLASAVVDSKGEATLTGTVPTELLTLGEHRIRLVGIRALDGAFVEEDGTVGITDELLAEIQRFDLGTQSTIAIYGENPEGASHTALRVIPLVPEAPWWTLWLILGAAVVGLIARVVADRRPRVRRIGSTALALGLAIPGVVLGWLSTVVAVTWWALGLGLLAAVLAALGPYRSSQDRVGRSGTPDN